MEERIPGTGQESWLDRTVLGAMYLNIHVALVSVGCICCAGLLWAHTDNAVHTDNAKSEAMMACFISLASRR
jgi:hypothetical protein